MSHGDSESNNQKRIQIWEACFLDRTLWQRQAWRECWNVCVDSSAAISWLALCLLKPCVKQGVEGSRAYYYAEPSLKCYTGKGEGGKKEKKIQPSAKCRRFKHIAALKRASSRLWSLCLQIAFLNDHLTAFVWRITLLSAHANGSPVLACLTNRSEWWSNPAPRVIKDDGSPWLIKKKKQEKKLHTLNVSLHDTLTRIKERELTRQD